MPHANEAKKYWDEQEPAFKIICKKGMQEYVETIPALKRSFASADRSVRCIDEGAPGGIRLAGSGILLDSERVEAVMKAAGATGIFVHEECGAAAEAFRRLTERERTKFSGADSYAAYRAQQLAIKLNIKYKGIIGFSSGLERMRRPRGLHVARIVYYDGTGQFNPSGILPPGFVVSRRHTDRDYALFETDFTFSIASGSHGFGDLITPQSPYLIVLIGDPRNPAFSLDELKREVEPIAARHGERVKVDGFTAPV